MPDVGDFITARLDVSPADETTAATLVVTPPTGLPLTPVVTGSDDGAVWTAPLTYTMAGVWRLSWTVTGTGAGREHELVSVAPVPGAVPLTGRTYATTTQLAEYLGAAPPLDAARLLLEASRMLERDFLVPAVYGTTDAGLPSDPIVASALAEAVCAQVEFWMEVGVENDISGPLQGVSIGSVQIQYGAGENRSGPSYYAPKMLRALRSLPGDRFRLVAWTV